MLFCKTIQNFKEYLTVFCDNVTGFLSLTVLKVELQENRSVMVKPEY